MDGKREEAGVGRRHLMRQERTLLPPSADKARNVANGPSARPNAGQRLHISSYSVGGFNLSLESLIVGDRIADHRPHDPLSGPLCLKPIRKWEAP